MAHTVAQHHRIQPTPDRDPLTTRRKARPEHHRKSWADQRPHAAHHPQRGKISPQTPQRGRSTDRGLAATAYHLLTGTTLFPHTNPAVVISHHLNAEPPRISALKPDLAAVDDVFSVGLAKRPDDRFDRCTAFAAALSDQLTSSHPSRPSAPTKAAPVPAALTPTKLVSPTAPLSDLATTPAQPSQGPWIAAAALLALVAVVGSALLFWPRQSAPNDASRQSTESNETGAPTSASPDALAPAPPPPLPPAAPPATTAPTLPASAIDTVILTPAEITQTTGGALEGYPSGPVELLSSSQGTTDNTHAIDPPDCAGVIFGAEQQIYAGTGYGD